MSSRDLFSEFDKLRSKLTTANPHHRARNPGVESDGIHLANMGEDVESSLCGGEKPDWTIIVDNVRGRFDQLDSELRQLQQVHQSQLRQGVNLDAEREKQERATALTDSISAGFAHCHKWIDMLVKPGAGTSQDHRVRKNVQVALATKLQKLSTSFRKDQRRFMQQLHAQSTAANGQDDPFLFLSKDDDLEEDVPFFSEAQLQKIDTMQDLVDERDKEVQAIAKSVAQLSEIFKELSTLVIDSGTILDRIDFNMEMVVDNVEKAEADLVAASKYNGKGISAWCIIALTIMCIIMAFVVGIKKGTK